MNEIVKKLLGKYDRSVVAVLVTIGMMFTFYMKMGDMAEAIIARSPLVHEMQKKLDVQEQINRDMVGKLNEISGDMKDIKRLLWRGR